MIAAILATPFNQEGLMQNKIDQYEQAAFFRAHQQAS